ncbi:MAG: peptidyl-prolyl cis-trans isomerase, partial [Gammaproteobacteria bacterium]|nr:peptidyl-prolyl cis-trans isomerase [Gammaproteobacteria bacterium]
MALRGHPGLLVRVIREPLVHFVAIGGVLFLGYAMLAQQPVDQSNQRIVVDAALVERLERDFVRRWQRPPDPVERIGLVDAYLREEVLYRQAMERGLERNDPVVRQRLARKMEAFAIINTEAPEEPTEAQLRAYFSEHRDEFSEPEQLSFIHVFLDRDLRGERLAEDARALLADLRASGIANAADAAGLGDTLPIRPSHENVTQRQVARQFGRDFAERLVELPTGSWQGPVASGFGLHLVLVTAHAPARGASFDDVAFEVRSAYLDNRRRQIRAAVIAEMM